MLALVRRGARVIAPRGACASPACLAENTVWPAPMGGALRRRCYRAGGTTRAQVGRAVAMACLVVGPRRQARPPFHLPAGITALQGRGWWWWWGGAGGVERGGSAGALAQVFKSGRAGRPLLPCCRLHPTGTRVFWRRQCRRAWQVWSPRCRATGPPLSDRTRLGKVKKLVTLLR